MATEVNIQDRLFFALAKEKHLPVLIDAGARGGVPEPWSFLNPDQYIVHGFEPDAQACEELKRNAPNHHHFHATALWNEKKSIPLHLNVSRATSSVYPTNDEALRDFPARNTQSRITESVVQVEADRMDSLVDEPFIDQLKIDVHSAEFEILQGAEGLLAKTFCVMIEAWVLEVHKGQKRLGDILRFMAEKGFVPYHFNNQYMAWHEAATDLAERTGRSRQVASVVLFFPEDLSRIEDQFKPRAAAIADIYGYPETALRILGDPFPREKKVIIDYWSQFKALKGGRVDRLLGRKQPYIAPVE